MNIIIKCVKCEEPCDGRLSSTVPREAKGEIPLVYSTDAVAVFRYGKYRSVYYRRHSIFRSAGFVWREGSIIPAISCTYLQERINQQNITALAEAPMPLAFLL